MTKLPPPPLPLFDTLANVAEPSNVSPNLKGMYVFSETQETINIEPIITMLNKIPKENIHV